MLTQKKKFSRKEMKEDALVTGYYKTVQYINNNKKTIAIYAGVLILVIAAAAFYIWNKTQQNEKAGIHLAKAMGLYNAGAFQEAINGRPAAGIKGLKEIADEFGSTESGETAKIFLANSFSMLGQFEEAYKTYDDYGGGNDLFKSAATAGVASYYEFKKEFKKAADSYKEAAYIAKSNPLNSDYMLKAGINYLDAGQKENALEILKQLKEDYPGTQSSREADRFIALAR